MVQYVLRSFMQFEFFFSDLVASTPSSGIFLSYVIATVVVISMFPLAVSKITCGAAPRSKASGFGSGKQPFIHNPSTREKSVGGLQSEGLWACNSQITSHGPAAPLQKKENRIGTSRASPAFWPGTFPQPLLPTQNSALPQGEDT